MQKDVWGQVECQEDSVNGGKKGEISKSNQLNNKE